MESPTLWAGQDNGKSSSISLSRMSWCSLSIVFKRFHRVQWEYSLWSCQFCPHSDWDCWTTLFHFSGRQQTTIAVNEPVTFFPGTQSNICGTTQEAIVGLSRTTNADCQWMPGQKAGTNVAMILSSRSLKTFSSNEKNFPFKGNGHELLLFQLITQFISPFVSRTLLSSPTLSQKSWILPLISDQVTEETPHFKLSFTNSSSVWPWRRVSSHHLNKRTLNVEMNGTETGKIAGSP
jgi:hypothetical protein